MSDDSANYYINYGGDDEENDDDNGDVANIDDLSDDDSDIDDSDEQEPSGGYSNPVWYILQSPIIVVYTNLYCNI